MLFYVNCIPFVLRSIFLMVRVIFIFYCPLFSFMICVILIHRTLLNIDQGCLST